MVSVLCAVLHALLSCLIPPANLLVIVAVCQLLRKHPGSGYIYVLNLATADLLVGVMCITEALDDVLDGDFDRSKSFCLLRISLSMTPCIGSILTLLLISLDRWCRWWLLKAAVMNTSVLMLCDSNTSGLRHQWLSPSPWV